MRIFVGFIFIAIALGVPQSSRAQIDEKNPPETKSAPEHMPEPGPDQKSAPEGAPAEVAPNNSSPTIPNMAINPNERVPEVRTADDYGVDLITGQLSYMVPMGSIGSGEQTLSLSVRLESGNALPSSPDVPSYVEQDGKITVSTPAFSATFRASDGRPVLDLAQSMQTLGNGDRLFTHRDGTQVLFKRYTLSAPYNTPYYAPAYLLYPNGKKITYTQALVGSYFIVVGWHTNFGMEIRIIGKHHQFINKAYDSSVSSSLSLDPVWPRAEVIGRGIIRPLITFSHTITYSNVSDSYTNMYGQMFTPLYTLFMKSSDLTKPLGMRQDSFLTSIQTNFDQELFIRYRSAGTSSTAGPIAYYVDQLRKGDLTVNYDNLWIFSYQGYSAYIRGKRLLASGEVASEVQSNWGLGSTPKPNFVSNASGATTYRYGPDFGGEGFTGSEALRSYQHADGREVIFTRDARDNVVMIRSKAKPDSGIADSVFTASYPASCNNPKTCNKPLYIIDERGNRTDYTYHEPSGGILSITGPAVNGIRPETRYSYVQRNAWIASPAGGYEQVPDPVWLLASTSTCQSSAATGNPAAPCALANDEVLTSYDYGPNSGPNNLFLRSMVVSAGGQALRSCYEYDKLGRQVTRTEPSANLASCY